MEPVSHSTCNMILRGNGGNVIDVPATLCQDGQNQFSSIATHWRPSADDLKILNAGGVVTLYVMSTQHPPVWMAVNHD